MRKERQMKIRELIKEMTLEEKAGMCSGADFWHLKGVERLGIPSVCVSDGPHGLRKQEEGGDHLGMNDSIQAVCFPAGCAAAASFDREVLYRQGAALGREARAAGVSVILGPAVNLKRSPLCGRNFEYYSEDPYLAGELASAMICGAQEQGAGTSIKHFAANSQEKRRMTSSSEVDERTMRELYLPAFETAIKTAKPWTVMCSYNKVNGTYMSENRKYLTEILRKEWGYDGCVVSDWGAVNDRVKGLEAGMDLEMPGSGGINDAEIVKAVREGRLDEAVVDQACERILALIDKTDAQKHGKLELETDHELAGDLEEECIVLLKNENEILPFSAGQKIAVIGTFAEKPRYQGGGSSHINSFRVTSALDVFPKDCDFVYAKGYQTATDKTDELLLQEAVKAAAEAEIAVIFAGLPDSFESEGYDRQHMRLPDCQNELIEAVCRMQPYVVVVLHNGSPVELPWADHVQGILEAYLGGQNVGRAVVRTLFGENNPSGHLPETFPMKLEDTPCYLEYGKNKDIAQYREGVFVGYRYYTSKNQKVRYPFGYGLSYTSFQVGNLSIDKKDLSDTETAKVSVEIENTGKREGKYVVQLYISPKSSSMSRPVRELKGFEKVMLEPGEKKRVVFQLSQRAFAYWEEEIHNWYTEEGDYEVQIGADAETILCAETIHVQASGHRPVRIGRNTTMGELSANPAVSAAFQAMMGGNAGAQEAAQSNGSEAAQEAISGEMMAAMMQDMPLRQLVSFVPGMTWETLDQMIAALNAAGGSDEG